MWQIYTPFFYMCPSQSVNVAGGMTLHALREKSIRIVLAALLLNSVVFDTRAAGWDGDPSLEDITFSFESFIDMNAYQFRRADEIRWIDVENGYRATGGSFDHNLLYMFSDLRVKQAITPNVVARVMWEEEEFYERREQQRPLLEIELRHSDYPVSVSLLGRPAYAKRDADLGLGLTLGERPRNYLRVAALAPDLFYNMKNVQDESSYRTEPGQWLVEGAYDWGNGFRMNFQWEQNRPLEFVLDDEVSVFAFENRNYSLTVTRRLDEAQTLGLRTRGFATEQSIDEGSEWRSQDIRYASVDAFRIALPGENDEWTVGLRYDEFRNNERAAAGGRMSFDFLYTTLQAYTTYYHPFRPHQAWELGLFVGNATRGSDYIDASVPDTHANQIEGKLTTAWELFSANRASTLTFALSWNLDELDSDAVDGGMIRLQTLF